MKPSAIVIGAGIAGLATARALATRHYRVTVVERSLRVAGASIRNFGMIWPIGQPAGTRYQQAMLSRRIWKETCDAAGIWYDEVGSLHVAYQPDEWLILQELHEIYKERGYRLLNADETRRKCLSVVADQLKGSLYSPDEMIVDPRIAVPAIAAWLQEKYGVVFMFGKAVTGISYPAVSSGHEVWEADEIYICSGADFETLYPEVYKSCPITKCKLQMMRMVAQPGNYRLNAAVCGPLSLLHYESFRAAPALAGLQRRYKAEFPAYLSHGIHVMVSQNQSGELTIGDSHEYGSDPDPFDKSYINQMIIDYLGSFIRFEEERIAESWNGVYAKLTNGEPFLFKQPEEGVAIINGLGGAGMTLGFGVCESLIGRKVTT
jgi:FAD dependent oxidoreductase TIGR03364